VLLPYDLMGAAYRLPTWMYHSSLFTGAHWH